MTMQYTENLIPTMTSNTSPSGVASASSIINVVYDAWKAFDKNISTGWSTSQRTAFGWVKYQFPTLKKISKYTIMKKSDDVYWQCEILKCPKNWTFEGSNDGTNWIVLDTQINITDWKNGVKKEFEINNANQYLQYKLNISSNNGSSDYLQISEIEMMERIYKTKFLLKDENTIISSKTTYSNNLIPIMTNNTSPSGIANCSSSPSENYSAYKLFDDNISNEDFWQTVSGIVKAWVSYKFTKSEIVKKYTMLCNMGAGALDRYPKDWTFEGSNDGANWTVLDTQTNITDWREGVKKEFIIKKEQNFIYYRLNITNNNGNSYYLGFSKLEMMKIEATEHMGTYPPNEDDFLQKGADDVSLFYKNDAIQKYEMKEVGNIGTKKIYSTTVNKFDWNLIDKIEG